MRIGSQQYEWNTYFFEIGSAKNAFFKLSDVARISLFFEHYISSISRRSTDSLKNFKLSD
ncbi:MAG: hypothetical protein CMK59_07060 [Proteobacteria bacterium]|nr:hypothetical protein [Pseudomonadota bacterium]